MALQHPRKKGRVCRLQRQRRQEGGTGGDVNSSFGALTRCLRNRVQARDHLAGRRQWSTPSRLASYPVACDAGRISYSFCLYDKSVMGVTDFVERPW